MVPLWHPLASGSVPHFLMDSSWGSPGYFISKLLFTPPSEEQMLKWAKEGKGMEELIKLASPPITISLLASLIQVGLFIAINFVFLQKGQTIGKKALGIQVWRRDSDEILPFQENLTKRVLPYFLAGTVLSAIHPYLGILILVDILCIFRKDRNTLHDDLAKSRVVKI